MATIDFASIEKKIRSYAKSSDGKKRMDTTLKRYVNTNVEKTDAGSVVINKRRMKEAADELVRFVQEAAYSSGVADSVLSDISTLKAGKIKYVGGTTWEVELIFNSSLTRASLEPETYGGVTNIIALFNNGYPKDAGRSAAIAHVSGFWHGDYVFARPSREALSFMQQAVNEFNAKYAMSHNTFVTLDAIYEQ